jgi:hypothetical protein
MQHELDILTIAPQMTALGVGLGIGLLVGLERERAKDEISRSAQAGVRTFALLGLSGVVAAFVGVAGICVGGFFLAAIVAANYLRTRGDDETTQGFTTEVAICLSSPYRPSSSCPCSRIARWILGAASTRAGCGYWW